MEKRYYFLSTAEYELLSLYDLTRFVITIPNENYDTFFEDCVIPYDRIDELARVVNNRFYKGADYVKLLAFVDRLQEILEVNDHS